MAAFDVAKTMGVRTAGLAGSDGGAMVQVDSVDHLFVVPSASVHRIHQAQATLNHILRQLCAQAPAPARSLA